MITKKEKKVFDLEILIVEDSPTQIERLKHLLEEQKYKVTAVSNGRQALEHARKNHPALVISDIVMPEMDGYALCKQIKTDNNLKNTPVMLVTGLSSPEDVIKGLQCGADNFIRKPYDENHILSHVRYLLANRELRDAENTQMGIELYLSGKKHFITSERQQILDLLMSTYEDAIRLNDELKHSNMFFNGLYSIAEGLNRCMNEREVIEKTLECAMKLPNVRAGWIFLRVGEKDFRLAASHNLPPGLQIAGAMDCDCLCRRQLLSGKLDSVINILECERLQNVKGDTQGLRYHATIPLWIGKKNLGAVNLIGAGQGSFSEGDLKILYGVGNQVGIALERVRLFEGLEKIVDERTSALRAEMAERKCGEEKIRENEKRYRSLIIATSQIVWLMDAKGMVTQRIQSWQEYTGQSDEEMLGQGWSKAMHPEDVERVLTDWGRALETKTFYETESRIRRHDGEFRCFAIRGVPVFTEDGTVREWVGTCTDVTDKKHLEEQLRQSQKVEAIGRLTGGIAHDFNNLLTVINGYAELLLNSLASDDSARPALDEIHKAGKRASALTSQLLSFSRRQVIQPKVININELIVGLDKMMRHLIMEAVELVTLLSPNLWAVKIDPVLLEQVLVNLIVNARDAMPNGGKLIIGTNNVTLDEEYAKQHVGVTPSDYVLIAVSDNGCGMNDEVKAHLFEPFFTTKKVGRGTGLGLATSYGIIKQGGGHIGVYSEPNHGTSVKVYLPRVKETTTSLVEGISRTSPLPRGNEVVLLVEDETLVRNLSSRILKEQGYHLLEAANGEEALYLVKSGAIDRIDLLFTDVVMPQMGGGELATKMREFFPNIKVLFTSGYPDNAIVHQGVLERDIAFIQKPFSPRGLAQKVREILDQSSYG